VTKLLKRTLHINGLVDLRLLRNKDDVLTYLSEFEAIAKQAKWTNEVKILQLRTLLTGEAKEVSQLANKNYEELRKL
jgi:NTP pyrophosphatase (non-canonical NTP hydrolase)